MAKKTAKVEAGLPRAQKPNAKLASKRDGEIFHGAIGNSPKPRKKLANGATRSNNLLRQR